MLRRTCLPGSRKSKRSDRRAALVLSLFGNYWQTTKYINISHLVIRRKYSGVQWFSKLYLTRAIICNSFFLGEINSAKRSYDFLFSHPLGKTSNERIKTNSCVDDRRSTIDLMVSGYSQARKIDCYPRGVACHRSGIRNYVVSVGACRASYLPACCSSPRLAYREYVHTLAGISQPLLHPYAFICIVKNERWRN